MLHTFLSVWWNVGVDWDFNPSTARILTITNILVPPSSTGRAFASHCWDKILLVVRAFCVTYCYVLGSSKKASMIFVWFWKIPKHQRTFQHNFWTFQIVIWFLESWGFSLLFVPAKWKSTYKTILKLHCRR